MSFFTKLKEVFEKIPIKTKFLKDLGFNNSYSGFRYFMQGRKGTPSKKLMDKLCNNMGYDYAIIPVKRTPEAKELQSKLEEEFFKDLDKYLELYEDDEPRVYTKHYGKESTVASAIEAFSTEKHDEKNTIDISDLF